MFLGLNSLAQTKRELIVELDKLRQYSVEYDLYFNIESNSRDEDKKKEVNNLYRQQVEKIKNGPNKEEFEHFLKNAIQKDSLKYKERRRYNYTFVSPLIVYRSEQLPTALDYYKVVYLSLFIEKKDRLLPPEHFDFLRGKKPALDIIIESVPAK